MNKKIVTIASFTLLMASPMVVFAIPNQIQDFSQIMFNILAFIWPLFVGFAIIMFIVAGLLFLTANGDAGKVRTARDAVIWGTVGVVVGILAFSIPLVVGTSLGTGI